jgi:hypothetical protein
MRMTICLGSAVAALLCAQPASAMPAQGPDAATPAIHLARLVCDDWGRCWARPHGYRDSRGYGEEYGYDEPYWRDHRPPTKWERKGFCPPGQAKKGNC